jgi:hypothetical protein
MRWLIPRVLAIWLMLILCASASLFIGRQQPPPLYLALLHLTDCELPCWIGIVPGKTTVEEAQKRIIAVYGTELTRYEAYKAFTIVDLPSDSIDVTSPNVSIRVGDETRLTRISVNEGKLGIVSEIFFEFLKGQYLLAELQSFLKSPVFFYAQPGGGIFQLAYQGASVVGVLNTSETCAAKAMTLELNPDNSPSTRMIRWAGWRNVQRLTGCW